MPSDIRSFFPGKPAASTASQEKKQEKPAPKKGRGRKVVEDSDEDDEVVYETPFKSCSRQI